MSGRASDRKKMPCNDNADQKLSAVATPNRENRKTTTIQIKKIVKTLRSAS